MSVMQTPFWHQADCISHTLLDTASLDTCKLPHDRLIALWAKESRSISLCVCVHARAGCACLCLCIYRVFDVKGNRKYSTDVSVRSPRRFDQSVYDQVQRSLAASLQNACLILPPACHLRRILSLSASDSQELDFMHSNTHLWHTSTQKYTTEDIQTHNFPCGKHVNSLIQSFRSTFLPQLSQKCLLSCSCSLSRTHTHVHAHKELILSTQICSTVAANQAASRGSRQWARCWWLRATSTNSCLTLHAYKISTQNQTV